MSDRKQLKRLFKKGERAHRTHRAITSQNIKDPKVVEHLVPSRSTIPPEATDSTHPDHLEWARKSGRCFAGEKPGYPCVLCAEDRKRRKVR